MADRDGNRYELTGVNASVIAGGMASLAKDCTFDQPLLARVFAPEGPATGSTGGF